MSEEAVLDVDDVEDVESEPVSGSAGDGGREAEASREPEARRGQREPSARRRFLVVEAVSLVVIVGLAVALIVSLVQLSNQNSLNAERASAVTAAKEYAHDVATYSYRHLQRDFGKVEHESTPSFRRSFIRSSGGLSKVLVQYKAVASARVLAAGISSITSTKAIVVLFVNQSVANSTQQGVSTDASRIEVTLTQSDGRWLLQDLRIVG